MSKQTPPTPQTPPATEGDKPPVDPQTPPVADPPANDPPAPAAKPLTQDDIDRAVNKAKKDWEKQIKDAQDKATLSETELLKKENDSLKRQNQLNLAESAVIAALEKAGAKSPKLLFNLKKDELEFDEKGKLTNLNDLIDDLKADWVDQFGVEKPTESIDAGTGTGKGAKIDASTLTKAQIEKMTPQEVIENMAEIDKFLAAQK